MNTAQRLFKSSAARVAFSVISATIAFFMMPFLVGHLGERWYGIWVVVASLVSTSYLLDLGMTTAVIRFVAKDLAQGDSRGANEVINTCLAIYTVLAMIVFLAAVAISMFAQVFVHDVGSMHVIRATLVLLGLQYAAEFPFKAFAGIISSYVRYDLLMLSRLLNLLLTNGLFVYLVSRGHGILSMAVTVLIVDQLSNFLYFRIARHLFRDLTISPTLVRKGMVRELFSYSTWSFIIQLANQARFRLDSVVIGWLISAGAVTYYAVGLRLVEYFVDFVFKATNMMTPIFTVDFVQQNMTELRRKYLFLARVNAVLALFGGGLIVILGRPFIIRWMGASFEQSYWILVILMSAMVFEIIGNHSDNMLYAVSKHQYLAVINTIEGLINIVLSVALARPLGIVGVALGTAIPLVFFRVFIIPYYVGQFIQLSTWRYYQNLVPVTVFTVAYLALFALASHPFLRVPSYLAIVVVGALALPAYLLCIPFVAFDSGERLYLLELLPVRARRFAAVAWHLESAESKHL